MGSTGLNDLCSHHATGTTSPAPVPPISRNKLTVANRTVLGCSSTQFNRHNATELLLGSALSSRHRSSVYWLISWSGDSCGAGSWRTSIQQDVVKCTSLLQSYVVYNVIGIGLLNGQHNVPCCYVQITHGAPISIFWAIKIYL